MKKSFPAKENMSKTGSIQILEINSLISEVTDIKCTDTT
jgi:hypothetical protein